MSKTWDRFFKPRLRKPNFVISVLVTGLRLGLLVLLMALVAGAGAVAGVARAYINTAPELNLALIDDQAQTSFFYDASGNLITDYKGTEDRVMISIAQMPLRLRNAFVAVEDARFYSHKGIDVKRIVGALVSNLLSGTQQGGSTITQQLIKNTILSSEQSYKRKIQEAYLAMQLETLYTKDEILESYLNTIYLGENYYGVYTAAQGYFGKTPEELTLRECAMLAGLCTNPYYYNPRRNLYVRFSESTDYASITNTRTDYALRMMYENQFITHDEYVQALDPATANVLQESPASAKGLYDYVHYVEYAVTEAVETLMKINGLEDTRANRARMENDLRTGGYHIYLCLDTDIQRTLEETVYNYSDYPALSSAADSVYRASNADGTYEEVIQPQAAAVVMDYRTGEIKAMVGSRTAPTQRKTLNRAVNMNMPVGSAIKGISVYAPAIELSGLGAGGVVYNMPLPIEGYLDSSLRETWPQNYGGSSYRGPETLREALTRSDNTAAAYAMMHDVGVENAVRFLQLMGVSDSHINATPFGVAMGSSGLTPLEMATAYGVLGNGGVYQAPISILGMTDSSGNVIWDAHAQQARYTVFSPSTAWLTVDMLKDVVSRGTGTAARIAGQTVAGKTGTNSDQKGVFFAGLTGYYVGTVWIGHDNYKSLSSRTTGGNSAAKLWQAFMSRIHTQKNLPDRDILEGDGSRWGLKKVTTCAVSGQVATEACRHDAQGYGTVTDWWPAATAPTTPCQMHTLASVCTHSGLLATADCPQTEQQGIITLPVGHPLQRFIGTEYEEVLTRYLGSFAALRLVGNTAADALALSTVTCTEHAGGGAGRTEDPTLTRLRQDASALLQSAQARLAALEAAGESAPTLRAAAEHLQSVLATDTDLQTLATAMAQLTRAMQDERR